MTLTWNTTDNTKFYHNIDKIRFKKKHIYQKEYINLSVCVFNLCGGLK